MDMPVSHILLMLPVLLHNLLEEEVYQYNEENPIVLFSDPSDESALEL